jgi:protein TonB
MYLDLEDYRPDTPRVSRAISVREGILISLLAHAVGVIVWLLMPPAPRSASLDSVSEDPVRYVQVMPPQMPEVARTRPQPPDQSPPVKADATPIPAPSPQPDRPAAAPTVRPVTGDLPAPVPTPAPASPTVPDIPTKVASDPSPSLTRPTTSMGNSLRNLQQFLQTQSVNTDAGDSQDPNNADIKFDAKGVDFNPWLRRFVAQIKRNWLVPQAAMMMKGHVVIQFNVLRNGTITDLRIVQTSGIPPFDLAAFNSLKLSNPTLALPTEYPDDKAFFTVTFHYNERER